MYKKIYRSMNLMSLVTLAITTVLIISACYTSFSKRLEEEIKSEAQLLAKTAEILLDNEDDLIQGFDDVLDGKRITLISPEGKILYDSSADPSVMENHLDRPEVRDAFEKGEGLYRRHSVTLNASAFYYALRLDNGYVIRLAEETKGIITMFPEIILPTVFTVILIYLLCTLFAKNITSSILSPINSANLTSGDLSNVYEELIPFLKKIEGQNREIKHQAEKVKREKLKLEAISDNMSEGLIVLDKNGNVISANNCIPQIFSISKEKLNGMNFNKLYNDESVKRNISRAYMGEKCHEPSVINGKTYQIFYSPVFEHKSVKGILILMFDISEESKAAQMRREFSANVSHELKTPLTAILGYSQIINNNIAKQEDIKNFTGKIEKEASRLITLIDDIIKLSKLDEECGDEYEKTNISLKEIINEVIDSLSEKGQRMKVSFIYDGSDCLVYANPRQIMELVYNLCDNAVKYNKENGSVTISVKDNILSVADTGIGIPLEHLDRIFERFYMVDKSRSKIVNGTGLGLSIVKHIAMKNDALIEVKSQVDIGTVFTVRFQGKEE